LKLTIALVRELHPLPEDRIAQWELALQALAALVADAAREQTEQRSDVTDGEVVAECYEPTR
jgi:hypothetical protein